MKIHENGRVWLIVSHPAYKKEGEEVIQWMNEHYNIITEKKYYKDSDYIRKTKYFKKDFLEYVNLDDLNKGKHSSEDIESFINESINSLCEWFRTFTIMGDPFNDEYFIYLEISGGDYITLQDLNPEWTDDEYKLDDEMLADYIDDIM